MAEEFRQPGSLLALDEHFAASAELAARQRLAWAAAMPTSRLGLSSVAATARLPVAWLAGGTKGGSDLHTMVFSTARHTHFTAFTILTLRWYFAAFP